MSDRLAAQITLGGSLPRRLAPRLCAWIREERLALDWGEEPFAPDSAEALLAARREFRGENVLHLYHDDAPQGEFRRLEAFLVRHRLPFDRQTDGDFERAPERVSFRTETGLRQWLTTPQGKILIPAEPLWDVLEQLVAQSRSSRSLRRRQTDPLTTSQVLAKLREVVAAPPLPLPGFEIGQSLGLRKRVA